MKKQICELLDISDVSYYRWRQDRLIISFLEKYFTEAEITEYIQTKKIKKLELIKDYSSLELNDKLNGSKETTNITNINAKLYNFDLGSLIALYLFLKNKKLLPLVTKDDFINMINENLKFIETDWKEDMFSTKYNQLDLIKYIGLFLDTKEILFISNHLEEIINSLEQIIELKRGFISKIIPKPKNYPFFKNK